MWAADFMLLAFETAQKYTKNIQDKYITIDILILKCGSVGK